MRRALHSLLAALTIASSLAGCQQAATTGDPLPNPDEVRKLRGEAPAPREASPAAAAAEESSAAEE
ncbi:MAG: hypothetical protein K1X74_18975 [Pirellulales bacterium]|nr:hypothetical protein [Pirellulales bacterium]